MGVTPRFGIPYPEGSDPNNVPLDALEAVTKIDTDAAIDMQGHYADRPVAGQKGRYYWATDSQLLYRPIALYQARRRPTTARPTISCSIRTTALSGASSSAALRGPLEPLS